MRRLCLAALVIAVASCAPASPAGRRQLVLLAIDGLDPRITTRLIRAGRLPHLAALAEASGVVPLVSTPAAETLSAWVSLATGSGPGTHGVFGLVVPDIVTAQPRAALPADSAPAHRLDRFWATLGRAGVPATLLFVPGTFPPQSTPRVTTMAGLPAPDWHGGAGAGYTWLATDVPADEVGPTRYGGRVERLTFTRNVAHASLGGVRDPQRIDLPLTVRWNPEARSANIDIAGESVYLVEGQQSRWIEVGVRLGLFTRVRGLVRLLLARAGNDVELFVSPIQWHPQASAVPLSAPAHAAAALYARLGPYRTSSWPDTGWALADRRLSEAAFLAAQHDTFSDRAEALLNHVDTGDWSLLMAGIETLDTTTRLLWRAIDPGHAGYSAALAARAGHAIDAMYEQLDALVGEVRGRLPPEAGVLIVSPYGQQAARTVVDLNRLLTDAGLLAWREAPRPVTLAALAEPATSDEAVDWSRTRARAMGPGYIYINRRDRWRHGIVAPGAEFDAVVAHLRARLEALVDPMSGQRLVARVRSGDEAFPGPRAAAGPDLVVSFAPGAGVSWDSYLGGLGRLAVARNTEAFSAEHASVDERFVAGTWLASWGPPHDAEGEPFSVLDVAPTILRYFGVPVPAGLEGTPRLDAQPRDSASSDSRR